MTRELRAEHICLTNRFKRLSIVHASSGIVCLLGANGAGKSSLLEVLAGLTPATEGEVLWGGQPTAQRSLAELAVERGYLAQKPSIQFEPIFEMSTISLLLLAVSVSETASTSIPACLNVTIARLTLGSLLLVWSVASRISLKATCAT